MLNKVAKLPPKNAEPSSGKVTGCGAFKMLTSEPLTIIQLHSQLQSDD